MFSDITLCKLFELKEGCYHGPYYTDDTTTTATMSELSPIYAR